MILLGGGATGVAGVRLLRGGPLKSQAEEHPSHAAAPTPPPGSPS